MAMQPEFSRLIAVEGITPDKVRKESIVATGEECAALAKRFDLRALSGFRADLSIRRVEGGDVVHLAGRFEADVVQTCVVSLRDVHSHVAGDFETFFSEQDHRLDEEEAEMYLDEEDMPEAIVNGNIDLGEVTAQYLSLELEPYPRAPGVSLAAQLSEAGAEVRNSPFAVLQGLNNNEKKAPRSARSAAKASKGLKAAKNAKPKKPGKKKAK